MSSTQAASALKKKRSLKGKGNTICLFESLGSTQPDLKPNQTLTVNRPVAQGARNGDRVLVGLDRTSEDPMKRGIFRWLVFGTLVGIYQGAFHVLVRTVYPTVPIDLIQDSAAAAILESARNLGEVKLVSGLASVNAPSPIKPGKEQRILGQIARAGEWERQEGPRTRSRRLRWKLGRGPGSY